MPSKKNKPKPIELAKSTATELLEKMGVQVEVAVSDDKENDLIDIAINTPEPGLLIGRHGETLNSIQSIVSLILRQSLGEWKTVSVDIEGWRGKQDDKLKELAMQIAEKVRESGQPQPLYNLSPAQRRVIHVELSSQKDLETASEGEGRDRYLLVSAKK